jgi:hypothetical protein
MGASEPTEEKDMAEEETVATEEEAFGKWLTDMQGPDAEEEAEVVEEKDGEVSAVERLGKKVEALEKEKQTEAIIDKFESSASEDAKRLFGIYRKGDEDPRQLKAIMELAVVKAREAEPAAEEVEAQAEKQAEKIAKEQYGVGPISGGSKAEEDDGWEKAREAVRQGDMHTAFKMWESLPPTGGVTTEE